MTDQLARVFVSGCINGRPIRFNETGVDIESAIWDRWVSEGRVVSYCPELAAGFAVPRPPAEIVGGEGLDVLRGDARVFEDTGRDVTGLFMQGAELAVAKALKSECVVAVLTDGSPTCGTSYIYDGGFEGGTRPGMGVAAQLLQDAGIPVFSEDRLAEADAFLTSRDRYGDASATNGRSR